MNINKVFFWTFVEFYGHSCKMAQNVADMCQFDYFCESIKEI